MAVSQIEETRSVSNDQPILVQLEAICAGSPRDMGFAQGEALRERIHAASDILALLEVFQLGRPWWMPFSIYRSIASARATKYLASQLQATAPAVAERLEAIALGAKIKLKTLYLLNSIEPILGSVQGKTILPPIGACSAVAVRGRYSATGEPVIARNFDYLPVVQPLYVMRASRPDKGFRSLDFTTAPLCGALDGMNDQGLCITYDYAFATDAAVAAPPISMIISELLQECSTVVEAYDYFQRRPRWGAGLLMLADASGDIASLEVSNSRCLLRRPAEGQDYIFHTNCFASREMRSLEIDPTAIFSHSSPVAIRGRRVLQSSEIRRDRFAQLLEKPNAFTADDLAQLMSDHGTDRTGTSNTICMHSDYWNTTACLQWFPKTRRARVAYDSACSARYTEFSV